MTEQTHYVTIEVTGPREFAVSTPEATEYFEIRNEFERKRLQAFLAGDR